VKLLKLLCPVPVLCGFILFLTGCSEEPPHIIQVFHQINVVKDLQQDDIYPQLSLFVHAEDDDGTDDIDSIYLIQDEQELFWELDDQNWESFEEQGEYWVGSNRIVMNDYSPLPWGDYRLLIIDAAGERDEREIYLAKPEYTLEEIDFPEVSVDNGKVDVSGGEKQRTYWVVREDGRLVKTVKTTDPSISVMTLTGSSEEQPADPFAFYMYIYDPVLGIGKIIGPFYF
jgi:hypothetical protein